MTRPAATDETACNLCGARDYDVVGQKDREGRSLRTVLCRKCGLVWTNPRPPAAEIDRYYETEYRKDYKGATAPPLRKILRGMLGAQDRLRTLRPFLHRNSVVLDVGCGAGELVFLLRREGVQAAGLEPDHQYADFARNKLNVPVQTAPVDRATVAEQSHDVVTMFHALEHVHDPRGVLRTVRRWLKRGGTVIVEVPNIESVVQAPSHRFHYAHLYHFGGATLAAMGEAAGLQHVSTTFSSDGGNVVAVFRNEAAEERPAAGLEASATRTRQVLLRHTSARHYLTAAPYVRAFQRLARRLREDRLLRRLKTVDDLKSWVTRVSG